MDDAWRELQESIFFPSPENAAEIRDLLAQRIMTAVTGGERDPDQLKAIALQAIDG